MGTDHFVITAVLYMLIKSPRADTHKPIYERMLGKQLRVQLRTAVSPRNIPGKYRYIRTKCLHIVLDTRGEMNESPSTMSHFSPCSSKTSRIASEHELCPCPVLQLRISAFMFRDLLLPPSVSGGDGYTAAP